MNIIDKLTAIGVNPSHIKNVKKLKNQTTKDYGFYYDLSDTTIESVDVSKIKGIGMRGEKGASFYEIASFKKGTLNEQRLERIITKFDNEVDKLNHFYNWFNSSSMVNGNDVLRLDYYEDIDEYYVSSGNHRATWALLINAPYLKAEVSYYNINPVKFSNYERCRRLQEEINKNVKDLSLHIEDDYICKSTFKLYNYPNMNKSFYNLDLCVFEAEQLLEQLNELKQDIQFAQKFPSFLRNVLFKYFFKGNKGKILSLFV